MGETNSSENTSLLTKFINSKLREDALEIRELKNAKADAKKIASRKVEMLSEIYRMLALNLDEPPTELHLKPGIVADGVTPATLYQTRPWSPPPGRGLLPRD